MNKTSRLESDAYAVEVNLLRPKAPVLVLAATCFVVLVAVLSWLGGAEQFAATRTETNHAARGVRRVEPPVAMPNSATSQPARDANRRADAAPEASPAAAAVPGPSPAGFAENASTNAEAPAAPAAREKNAAAANAAPDAGARNVAGGGYAVQAGSYPNASEANERVSTLRAAGFEARALAVELPKRGTWYRVYAGRFASREEAVAYDKKLRASGAASETIVTAVQN